MALFKALYVFYALLKAAQKDPNIAPCFRPFCVGIFLIIGFVFVAGSNLSPIYALLYLVAFIAFTLIWVEKNKDKYPQIQTSFSEPDGADEVPLIQELPQILSQQIASQFDQKKFLKYCGGTFVYFALCFALYELGAPNILIALWCLLGLPIVFIWIEKEKIRKIFEGQK